MTDLSIGPDTETLLKALRGDLPETERDAVMAGKDAKSKLAFMEAIQAAAPGQRPIDEQSWERLQQSIAVEKALNSPAANVNPHLSAGAGGRPAKETPANDNFFIRHWKMAASLVAAFCLGTVQPYGFNAAGPNSYEYATSSGEMQMAVDLIVAFQPDASEADISKLLVGAELQIVAGPSALGLYQLKVNDKAQLDDAVSRLDERKDVIESFQRN